MDKLGTKFDSKTKMMEWNLYIPKDIAKYLYKVDPDLLILLSSLITSESLNWNVATIANLKAPICLEGEKNTRLRNRPGVTVIG